MLSLHGPFRRVGLPVVVREVRGRAEVCAHFEVAPLIDRYRR
jgi:hypothetical protein